MKPFSPVMHTLCVIVMLALTLQAQDSPVNPSKIVVKDSLITVIPSRPAPEIAAGIEHAKALLAQAESKRMFAQSLVPYTESRIEVKEREIDLIEKRIDIADEAKRESEVVTLKGELQMAKNLLDILKGQKNVREAELDAAAAQYEYAQALQISFELEHQLALRRSEHVALASTESMEQAGIIRMVGDLITKTLDAQLEAAKKEQTYTARKQDLMARRVKLHKLQNTFAVGSN